MLCEGKSLDDWKAILGRTLFLSSAALRIAWFTKSLARSLDGAAFQCWAANPMF